MNMHPIDEVMESAARAHLPAPRGTVLGQTEIHVKGNAVLVPSAQIQGRTVIVTGRWMKTATVQDEELVEGETIEDPDAFVSELRKSRLNADIFTFAQKLCQTVPRYKYQLEWDNLAIIPITTFSDWWEKRVDASVRRAVRKAEKSGIVVSAGNLDDAFVEGITKINNETPIRQGRPFWHFDKSFDAVRDENSTYAERNTFL
jgi:hypothetical protein